MFCCPFLWNFLFDFVFIILIITLSILVLAIFRAQTEISTDKSGFLTLTTVIRATGLGALASDKLYNCLWSWWKICPDWYPLSIFILPPIAFWRGQYRVCYMIVVSNKKLVVRSPVRLRLHHERALRFVFNEKQRPYSELLNKIGLPSLENQRLAKIVCTVFNVINNEHAPKSIKELIGFRNNKYSLRGSDILKRPKASTTTYGLKSWRFTAPKLYLSIYLSVWLDVEQLVWAATSQTQLDFS